MCHRRYIMTLEYAVIQWMVVGAVYVVTCVIFWWLEVKP